MSGWVPLQVGWFRDPAVAQLSQEATHVFLWAFTHDTCSARTGLTVGTPAQLVRALNDDLGMALDEDRLTGILAELFAKPLIQYDGEVLWVMSRARAAKTPEQVSGAQLWVRKLAKRDSEVMRRFVKRYPRLSPRAHAR
jgi:hypothetical protein